MCAADISVNRTSSESPRRSTLESSRTSPLEVAPSYNIASTTMQPVIRNNRDTGEREMVAMRWGMVPNFAKSLADFKASQPSTQRPRLFFQNHYGAFRFIAGAAQFPQMAFTNGSDWM